MILPNFLQRISRVSTTQRREASNDVIFGTSVKTIAASTMALLIAACDDSYRGKSDELIGEGHAGPHQISNDTSVQNIPIIAGALADGGAGITVASTGLNWDIKACNTNPIIITVNPNFDAAQIDATHLLSLLDVKWGNLEAGTTIQVAYNENPYHVNIFMTDSGTETNPICLMGIPGPNGEQPVFDANGAVTAQNPKITANYVSQFQGLGSIQIVPASYDAPTPRYNVISGLKIQGVRPSATYTGMDGMVRNFKDFSAGMYLWATSELAVINCFFYDSQLGVYGKSGYGSGVTEKTDPFGRNIAFIGNVFDQNGAPNNWFCHNAYIDMVGPVFFKGNNFASLVVDSQGAHLKSRAPATISENNFFDLSKSAVAAYNGCDPEESLQGVKSGNVHWETTFVGNVIIASDKNTHGIIPITLGGDSGNTENYHPEPANISFNTLYAIHDKKKTWKYPLIRVAPDGKAIVSNNIFVDIPTTAGAASPFLSLIIQDNNVMGPPAQVWFSNNFIQAPNSAGFTLTDPTSPVMIVEQGPLFLGADAGLVDPANGNFNLKADSICIGKADPNYNPIPSNPTVLPKKQLTPTLQTVDRKTCNDLGAIEH